MKLNQLLSAGVLLTSTAAHADVTYIYTGHTYDEVYGPYTSNERITGSFTLPGPLAPNLNEPYIPVLAYSFSDGIETINQDDAISGPDYTFWTDAYGNITQYHLFNGISNGGTEPDDPFGVIEAYLYQVPNAGSPGYTIAAQSFKAPLFPGYAEAGEAGTLVQSTKVTPEPSTFALFGTGVLRLGSLVRGPLR